MTEQTGHRFRVLRRVYAGRSMSCDEHMNSYTIFQRAQLLERFGFLQRTRFPPHKLQKQFAPKTIDSLMAKIPIDGPPGVGDCGAREIERSIIEPENHLHLMG